MEKKMTALEILIEDLRATHTAIPTNTKENRRVKGAYVDAIQIAKSLLPKERDQIEEAWYDADSVQLFVLTPPITSPKPITLKTDKMKFRKKPVVIDSIQWTGDNEHEIYRFVGRNLRVSRPPSNYEHDNNVSNDIVNIFIPTLEGEMKANRFDWIIKGVQGECYPCKPDIFEKTYELVLEEYAAQKQSPMTAVEQLESAEKKPNRLGEFVGAIPDFFIDESPQEGGTVEATDRMKVNANEFINQAIAMIKDECKEEWLIAGYNGIVSLLQ